MKGVPKPTSLRIKSSGDCKFASMTVPREPGPQNKNSIGQKTTENFADETVLSTVETRVGASVVDVGDTNTAGGDSGLVQTEGNSAGRGSGLVGSEAGGSDSPNAAVAIDDHDFQLDSPSNSEDTDDMPSSEHKARSLFVDEKAQLRLSSGDHGKSVESFNSSVIVETGHESE